ncbi:hypothetical protein MJA45_21395 [Paenibacillus aurantius]|uniref:Uncharacterized protein n=1 Tax=Paenibacillus aurantius TaxID=2918900 RepID=A0AA96RGK8_9BACL|nr:hypothetical protein [Paenibacillus aurantius]WNQ10154.1 hypothetical protein MJA45_21395 [Paenibacillus aurantius]
MTNAEQLARFEEAVRTAEIMIGQPKAIAPDFKLIPVDRVGKELTAVHLWTGGRGILEVNDLYCTLTEDGKALILSLLKDAGAY